MIHNAIKNLLPEMKPEDIPGLPQKENVRVIPHGRYPNEKPRVKNACPTPTAPSCPPTRRRTVTTSSSTAASRNDAARSSNPSDRLS